MANPEDELPEPDPEAELAAEAALLDALARAPLIELLADDSAELAEEEALDKALEAEEEAEAAASVEVEAEPVPVAEAEVVAGEPPPTVTPADEQ